MIYTHKKQFRIVTGSTAAEFQDALNQTMNELAANRDVKNVTYQFNTGAGHCAYIVYDIDAVIPETLADRLELKGIRFYCGDCAYFKLSGDKRIKYTTCGKGKLRRGVDTIVCDEFIEAMEEYLNDQRRSEKLYTDEILRALPSGSER